MLKGVERRALCGGIASMSVEAHQRVVGRNGPPSLTLFSTDVAI
jgi:hypothetical protein